MFTKEGVYLTIKGDWNNNLSAITETKGDVKQWLSFSMDAEGFEDSNNYSVTIIDGNNASQIQLEYPGKPFIDLSSLTNENLGVTISTGDESNKIYNLKFSYINNQDELVVIKTDFTSMKGDMRLFTGQSKYTEYSKETEGVGRKFINCEVKEANSNIEASLPYLNGSVFEVLNPNSFSNQFSVIVNSNTFEGANFYVKVGQGLNTVKVLVDLNSPELLVEGVKELSLDEGTIYGFMFDKQTNEYRVIQRSKY